MLEEETVEEGDHGSSLAADSLLRDSKVGDGSLSETGSEDGTLGHGERRASLAPVGHGKEPDGLSVGGDNIDVLLKVESVALAELFDSVGEDLTELDVDLAELLGGGSVLTDNTEDGLLDGLRELNVIVLEDLHVKGR